RHLVWAEGGMLRLMRQIRAGEEGAPADFDLDRYNAAGVNKLKDEMPADLLLRLEKNRNELLAFVESLEEGDWEKKGRHGSLRIMSIREILERIADHEAQHLADLREALS
ncbi:MAG: DinB family protein, partial [Chloroflexi bacterium]|nr:DinB family protein [Chloroflexota bacterium]